MAEIETKTEEKKEVKKEKKSIYKRVWFFWVFGFIIIGIIAGLISYKSYNPEFNLFNVLIGFGIIVVIGLIIVGVLYYQKRKKDEKEESEEKIPKPKSPEEMIEIARKLLELPKNDGGFENHIKEIIERRPRTSGGNQMFHLRIVPVFNDYDSVSNSVIKHFDFLFNQHFPENPAIFTNLSGQQVITILDRIARNPELKDIEETKSFDPITGREVTHRKISTRRRKKKTEEKKEI